MTLWWRNSNYVYFSHIWQETMRWLNWRCLRWQVLFILNKSEPIKKGGHSCLWLTSCVIVEQCHKARLPKARLDAPVITRHQSSQQPVPVITTTSHQNNQSSQGTSHYNNQSLPRTSHHKNYPLPPCSTHNQTIKHKICH